MATTMLHSSEGQGRASGLSSILKYGVLSDCLGRLGTNSLHLLKPLWARLCPGLFPTPDCLSSLARKQI